MTNKKNKAALWLGMFIVMGIITLILSELSLYSMDLTPKQGGMVADEEVGWVKTSMPEYNDLPEKESPRVLFVGDSYTENGVFDKVFEEIISKKCGNIETYNVGVSGYGTTQEYLALEKYGPRVKPDLVILTVFLWNDLSDNLNDIYYSHRASFNRPVFNVETGDIRNDSQRTILPNFLTNHFWTARFVEQVLVSKLGVLGLKGYGQLDAFIDYYQPEPTKRSQHAWNMMEALLDKFRTYTQKDLNSDLLMVSFDNGFTVEKETMDIAKAMSGFDEKTFDINKPSNRLTQIAQNQNIKYVNALPLFQVERVRSDQPIYSPGIAGHFTPKGKEFLGEILAGYVIQNKMLNCQ